MVTIEEGRNEYAIVKNPWSSQELYIGTYDEIKTVVLRNTQRISSEPDFSFFRINAYQEQNAAQISANFGDYFVPIRVWWTGDTYLTCGNSDFK